MSRGILKKSMLVLAFDKKGVSKGKLAIDI